MPVNTAALSSGSVTLEWPEQRRRWPVCGCPPALWHPHTWVLNSLFCSCRTKSQCPSTFRAEPRGCWAAFVAVSPLNHSPQREIWCFSKTDGPALLTTLSKMMHHWIWLLSFVVLPFFLSYSPLEMAQRMRRNQNKQNLPKFKLMHKNPTPLWCN